MNSTLIQGELQILCLWIVKVEHLPGDWPAKNIGQRMVIHSHPYLEKTVYGVTIAVQTVMQ